MTVNWTRYISDMDTFFQAEGQDVDVLLRDGVTTFTIKGMKAKLPVENLTDGLQQNAERMSVMASRWDAGAGRAPEKGDQLTYDGRRQAIQSVSRALGGNQTIGYRLTVLG